MPRRLPPALAAAALLALLGAVLLRPPAAAPPDPPLTATTGQTLHLADFPSARLLVYFGYTHCPDICPTTLANIQAALHQLGPTAAHYQPLFITLDPARDTPTILAAYVRAFGPNLIGLTGPAPALAALRARYGIEATPGSNGSIDHTSVLLLLNRDATLRGALPPDLLPGDLAQRLQRLG